MSISIFLKDVNITETTYQVALLSFHSTSSHVCQIANFNNCWKSKKYHLMWCPVA